MIKHLTMPKLGAEMTTGKIVDWRKKEGEWVEKGAIIVVIETDKLTVEVESSAAGYLLILKQVDEEIPVAGVIGILCDSQEELQGIRDREAAYAVSPEIPRPENHREPSAAHMNRLRQAPSVSDRSPQNTRISPLARKLAKEHGLDISVIEGTGPEGRIKQEDVLRALENQRRNEVALSDLKLQEAAAETQQVKTVREVIPIRGMRKVIADRLYRSIQQMAQFTEMGEIDVTETVTFRQKLLEQEAPIGIKISYNAILVKVVALILRDLPVMNSSIVGEEIHVWNEINVGIAVSLDNGLVVPVIPRADRKSIIEIQHLLDDLIQRSRHNKLTPDEVSGGTFTISNFGSYGALFGTPIINPPEVALLGVGIFRQVPAIIDNAIAIRWSMSYALTMDHRIIDGATGGKFIERMRQILANPSLLEVMW